MGEITTARAGLTFAQDYRGDVLVADGVHDLVFCGTKPIGSLSECGTTTQGPLANTREQFPSAKSFEVYIVPQAASAWVKHYQAPEAIEYVMDWLDDKVNE